MITAAEVRKFQNNVKKDIIYCDEYIRKVMQDDCVGCILHPNTLENPIGMEHYLKTLGYKAENRKDGYFYICWSE